MVIRNINYINCSIVFNCQYCALKVNLLAGNLKLSLRYIVSPIINLETTRQYKVIAVSCKRHDSINVDLSSVGYSNTGVSKKFLP